MRTTGEVEHHRNGGQIAEQFDDERTHEPAVTHDVVIRNTGEEETDQHRYGGGPNLFKNIPKEGEINCPKTKENRKPEPHQENVAFPIFGQRPFDNFSEAFHVAEGFASI